MRIETRRFSCERDGLTIRGRELRGEGERLPIAILSHGFMSNMRSARAYAVQLAALGYAAYIFDFCGGCTQGTSDGPTTEMTVLTEVEDLKAVVAYARSLPGNDPERVLLLGMSQGGFVSALAAAELGKAVEGLVLLYPAFCIPDDARAGKMLAFRFDPEHIPETISDGRCTIGREYPACMQGFDPYAVIGRYRGPVLLVHGDADDCVDIRYSVLAAEAYEQAAPRRCDFVRLEGAGHGFDAREDRVFLDALRPFLQGKHLLLSVDVELTGFERLCRPRETVQYLPFTGESQTPWFRGAVEPGACDRQEKRPGWPWHCRADYYLTGEDYTGAPCRLHVVNEDKGQGWRPSVRAGGGALSFLADAQPETVVENRPKGPLVRIFARVP